MRSDPYDPLPVIEYAIKKANKEDVAQFVVVAPGKFVHAKDEPSPRRSHWKVTPNGEVFAHLGGMDVTEFDYIRSLITK